MRPRVRAGLARLGVEERALAWLGRVTRAFLSGVTFLSLMTRVVARRAGNRLAGLPPREQLPAWNTLFRRDLLPRLEREKRILEAFDHQLMSRLNEKRLLGQILFEYGTLLNAHASWSDLSVLDIGTGGSRLPHWMASQGASVVCFEYPRPVERRTRGLGDLAARLRQPERRHRVSWVNGDMLELPFASDSFDLVTSLSVIEHLDTSLTDRRFVPYPEQRARAARVLSEMVRVAKPGGSLYLTSDCCDYSRTTADAWRPHYYYVDGPALSGAWPSDDVDALFYQYLTRHGCSLVGPNAFAALDVDGDRNFATFRGPFFSCFSVLARKDARGPAAEPR